MSTGKFDVIVVGAGVAGGVFAASQLESTRVLVVERDLSEPDRIVGELMQPGGVQALSQLGLGQLLEGIDAQEVKGYNIIMGDQHFIIKYDEVEKGVKGMGLRNGKFLTRIRETLKDKPNVTLVQGNVIDIIEEDNQVIGITYTNEEKEKISEYARLTVVCDGPMSMLRNKLSKPNKKVTSYFMGLILKDLDLEYPSYGHMIVTGDAPILVYPVHTNAYRILIDYPGTKPPRMGHESKERIKEEISKVLPSEMVASFQKAMDEEQLKVMPNHSMVSQAYRKAGAVLLGDSLNMRHPLTGGGMTAVFSDIICLNKYLNELAGFEGPELEKAISLYYENRRKGVETINILADALYQSFMNPEMKEAVFDYLHKGGEQAAGPLAILAGLNKDKKLLLKHFFKVATQDPIQLIKNPGKQIRLYKHAADIMRPILKEEEVAAMI